MLRARSLFPRYRSWALVSSPVAALVAALAAALTGCATAPTPSPPQWVVVTPLTAAAADPAAPWFARAASLALRTELALLPGLMVVAPPPAGRASADTDLALPAAWIVGGSVHSDGNGTRFDIALSRRGASAPTWQRRFDYPADGDAARWRRDIPQALAAQIGSGPGTAGLGDLGACRSQAAAAGTLRAFEAFGSYRTRDDLLRMRGWLEEALRHEPGCAEAQAHLAMTHVSELSNRWSVDPPAQLALADRLARQALAAEPNQPYAHLARVQLLRMQGQVAAAVDAAATLTRLDPSNGLFVGRLAALQFDAGNASATLAAARRMLALPNGTLAVLQQGMLFEALALYALGDEASAAQGLRKLVALNPQNGMAWRFLAGVEGAQQHDAEAAAALQRFLALAPPGQSIRSLRANETAVADAQFLRQRERFYAGLRRAGLPE